MVPAPLIIVFARDTSEVVSPERIVGKDIGAGVSTIGTISSLRSRSHGVRNVVRCIATVLVFVGTLSDWASPHLTIPSYIGKLALGDGEIHLEVSGSVCTVVTSVLIGGLTIDDDERIGFVHRPRCDVLSALNYKACEVGHVHYAGSSLSSECTSRGDDGIGSRLLARSLSLHCDWDVNLLHCSSFGETTDVGCEFLVVTCYAGDSKGISTEILDSNETILGHSATNGKDGVAKSYLRSEDCSRVGVERSLSIFNVVDIETVFGEA